MRWGLTENGIFVKNQIFNKYEEDFYSHNIACHNWFYNTVFPFC